jgi:CBS domain-containing protein
MDNLDTFLAGHPPFDAVAAEELTRLAAGAEIRELVAGETALVEDGPPASGLWVLLAGAMDIVHQGEVVQILEPGECFGHPSLLTGMAPAFSVRAREPSRCALLAPEPARRVLATEAGVAYVAQTMRGRLTQAGHIVHGLQDVGTTPVSAIMRSPTWADRDEPIVAAARRLTDGCQALLVSLPGPVLGIVTAADIGAAVAAGLSAAAPLGELARSPAPTVSARELAIEATVDMLAAGADHVAVTDGERVCGILSARDLLGLDVSSPIGLRHTILGAADITVLRRAASHLPQLFLALTRAGVPGRDLGRVLSLAHDAILARLIDFSIAANGPAPAPWVWLDLGSAARREFTLASDQDNALGYGDPPAGTADGVDAYFARLAAEVNDGLAQCGIGGDDNGVLARNPQWRMPRASWLRTFDECLSEPDESHLVRATVSFDFRAAAGGLSLVPELTARVRAAREHPQFMRLLARSAAGFPVALGFRGQLAPDRDGQLDIKRGGIIPLVNVVRFHALSTAVTISPTVDRIDAVLGAGGLSAEEAAALREAYEVISGMRFAHHASLIEAGRLPDNLIAPGELAPIARSDLREALAVVRRAQRRIPV